MKRIFLPLAALALASAPAPLLAGGADVESVVADDARSDASRALDEGRRPATVLTFADVGEGAVVADFMAGGGYYTEMLAGLVGPEGRVYAVNPVGFHNTEAWEPLLARHANIRTMPVDPRAMMLAPGSVDMVFTHLVFHDLYWESEQYKFPRLDPDAMLTNWFAALRPGGTVIVVDHHGPAGDPRDVTQRLHRIDPATVVAAMTRAGFELVGQSDALRNGEDDHEKLVFDPSVRGKTDRFVMKFRRPA